MHRSRCVRFFPLGTTGYPLGTPWPHGHRPWPVSFTRRWATPFDSPLPFWRLPEGRLDRAMPARPSIRVT